MQRISNAAVALSYLKPVAKLGFFEAIMGRTRAALTGLVCAFAALATPAAAFTAIDPLTRLPLYSAEEAARAQASPIPREVVSFDGRHAPGTIVVSTTERRLYYVLGDGKAVRYGVGVGRPGFQWGGAHSVTMKREWPDWRPPAAMLKRRPDLPRHMAGGPDNPLGARALYIGSTIYRIHGSNEPETIGEAVSSGCIRMTNEDVTDLYSRAKVGARVVVQR
jgi:lipoprotein-anchoring transpeptidase ErfK/SrfK